MAEKGVNQQPRRVYWQGPEQEPPPDVIEARNRFRNELGAIFQHAQWEAYESYCAWEKEMLLASNFE